MPANGANVRQRRIARTLRDWRKSQGATLDDVAKRLRWSGPKLSRFERADVIAGPAEIIAIAAILGIEESERDRLVSLAMASYENGWWQSYSPEVVRGDFEDYLEVEAEATQLRSFEIHLVPGLLQTAGYYNAVLLADGLEPDGELVRERMQLRQERQDRLDSEDAPLHLHAIVHESALHLPVGGPEVMHEQLDHIASRGEQSNVTVQLLPLSVGAYPGMGAAFHRVTFGADNAQGVYLENLHYGLYLEEEAEIRPYAVSFEHLADSALDPETSAQRIKKIGEGWA